MKTFKTILGVTLLEIMLVLAIAAMIIVMSIRYYQTTQASQQANTVAQSIQAIIAASDNLSQAAGSYTCGSIASAIPNVLPANVLQTPWNNGTISAAAASANQITITIPNVPVMVCPLLNGKYIGNPAFKTSSCTSGGITSTFTVSYSNTGTAT